MGDCVQESGSVIAVENTNTPRFIVFAVVLSLFTFYPIFLSVSISLIYLVGTVAFFLSFAFS